VVPTWSLGTTQGHLYWRGTLKPTYDIILEQLHKCMVGLSSPEGLVDHHPATSEVL